MRIKLEAPGIFFPQAFFDISAQPGSLPQRGQDKLYRLFAESLKLFCLFPLVFPQL